MDGEVLWSKCKETVIVLLWFLIFYSILPLTAAGYKNYNVVWEHDFGVNIDGLAVAEGKVFVTTHGADLYCLDERDGKTLWKYNFGAYSEGGFLTEPIYADGLVFVGFRGSRLAAFDAEKGTLLWKFDPNASSSFASKTPPYFWVANGKVFTSGDGFYAVNAKDGKLLWKYADYYTGPWSRPTYVRGVCVEGERVFATGAELVDGEWIDYIYRLNPDDGSILWKTQDSMGNASIVGNEGFLNIYDYYRSQGIVCLNETDGSELWNYTISGRIFQPTIANGLVLFGASDGNFYALNVTDGSLKWKFEKGCKNPKGKFDFAAAKTAHGQVFMGWVDAQMELGESVSGEYYKYEGCVYALNLSDGLPNWAINISNTAWGGSTIRTQSILFNVENRTLYVTTYADIYSLNAEKGTIQWMLHFDYWVLPPIPAYNKLFAAADLKIIAFGEAKPTQTKVSLSLLLIGAIVLVGIGAAAIVVVVRRFL
ncbi:MAG: PQQ-binding-like beta-propeller repeat protein [Candidatus Bathyarchaeales archaeon]